MAFVRFQKVKKTACRGASTWRSVLSSELRANDRPCGIPSAEISGNCLSSVNQTEEQLYRLLWKPGTVWTNPWQLDITAAAQTGKNEVEFTFSEAENKSRGAAQRVQK